MTHTAHTPVPWTLASRQLIVTDNAWRTPIAICHDNKSMVDGVSQQESDSNARLIAAAPELLEALESLRDTLNRNGYATEHADAAIAKARGQK